MRLSRYFLPVLKEAPSDAQIVSHQLMLRAGMIRQEAAGIYAWLPLGLKVLKKVEQIVREEMDRAGAIELLMPTLQLADLWRESGRYDAYGPEMLRIVDRHERELLYGPTNEEVITEIFRGSVKSYKDLPKNLYHAVEVPRRAPSALRRDARPRVPDEGRLQLRPRRRGRAQGLQPHVRGLSEPVLAHGPEGRADARRHRPDRRRPQPRVHRPGRHRRKRRVLPQGPGRDGRARPGRRLVRRPAAAGGPAHGALRGHRGNARRSRLRRGPRGRPPVGARHRGGPHLLVRHQVFRADEGPGHRAGRQGRAGADGQLRRRRLAPAGRDHRGQPRRGRHHLARVGGPVRRRHHQHAPGRRRLRRGLRDRLQGAQGRRPRPALRRHRHPRRRQVRHHGPDRRALAADRRPQGHRRGRGRDQEPQDRRAPQRAAGRRDRPALRKAA
jgi:hypothetical protein